jgi:hypothetical protein
VSALDIEVRSYQAAVDAYLREGREHRYIVVVAVTDGPVRCRYQGCEHVASVIVEPSGTYCLEHGGSSAFGFRFTTRRP